MSEPRLEEREYLDTQTVLYREIGQALYEMLDPSHYHHWTRILLEATQVPSEPEGTQSFRVTLTLNDGMELPLIARPTLIELCGRLDRLARTRLNGSSWSSFTYDLHPGPAGPAFKCSYVYPEVVH